MTNEPVDSRLCGQATEVILNPRVTATISRKGRTIPVEPDYQNPIKVILVVTRDTKVR